MAAKEKAAEVVKPEIELGAPFADNAVLQRNTAVPVWGWCKPGVTATVSFAGQSKTATADERGKWMVRLDPLTASYKPETLTIKTSEGKERTIKNVLVGEVWFASGQSNMQWVAAKSSCAKLEIKPHDGVAPIREFQVTSCYAQLFPIEHATGEWKNGTYGEYSAIALSFANTLQQELDVPIGILNCSFSQTQIQAWTPREGFRDGKDDYTKAIYQNILESDPRTPEHKAAWEKYYQSVEGTLKENATRVEKGEAAQPIPSPTPGNLHDNRDPTWLFNARLNPVIPYAVHGAIWNQGYANMSEGFNYYNNLHSLIRGWRIAWDRPELPVYFHQFYTAGDGSPLPAIGGANDMRFATWLARDIPHTGMASQIDIGGAIHYRGKALPGLRLALQALKHEYPDTILRQIQGGPALTNGVGGKAADLIADGPMFKSYTVDGNKLIVTLEHAGGGLVVAETKTSTHEGEKDGFERPIVIPDGESQVKLFYLADEKRVWHPATMKIDGDKVILTAAGVASPRGVSYASGGIAWLPNLYNAAMLPTTPFIYYDQKMVTAQSWPDQHLQIAGEEAAPNVSQLEYLLGRLPILSSQFRDNAVLQSGEPVIIWGAAAQGYLKDIPDDAVIRFSFNGVKTSFPINKTGPNVVKLSPDETRRGDEGLEWQVTLPPMPASSEPKTLTVELLIGEKVMQQRICKNIVIGDVWYVSLPGMAAEKAKKTAAAEEVVVAPMGDVRVMTRGSKSSTMNYPSRYTVSVSENPDSRFGADWNSAGDSLAGFLGKQIYARTKQPVGIICMQNSAGKEEVNPSLKSWIPFIGLKDAPSLMSDYKTLAAVSPGNAFFDANARRYVDAWKVYWSDYIPTMIETKAIPDGVAWGTYPKLSSEAKTEASQSYNLMTHSFTPTALKGIIFVTGPDMFTEDQGANFGEQLSALANCWRTRFRSPKARFFFTVPDKKLAPKITAPGKIDGPSTAIPVNQWPSTDKTGQQVHKILEQAVSDVYR